MLSFGVAGFFQPHPKSHKTKCSVYRKTHQQTSKENETLQYKTDMTMTRGPATEALLAAKVSTPSSLSSTSMSNPARTCECSAVENSMGHMNTSALLEAALAIQVQQDSRADDELSFPSISWTSDSETSSDSEDESLQKPFYSRSHKDFFSRYIADQNDDLSHSKRTACGSLLEGTMPSLKKQKSDLDAPGRMVRSKEIHSMLWMLAGSHSATSPSPPRPREAPNAIARSA